MRSFLLMLTFLTRIPIPIRFEIKNQDFEKGLLFMPLIGLLIGSPLYILNQYVPLTNTFLMSLLTVILYVLVTGGLHLDGIADYFDGIFSGRKRDRILEIMKDSHTGSFGVVGLCLYFLSMFVLLINVNPIVILLMPFVGKSMAVMLCAFGKYPRNEGMGKSLIDFGKKKHGVMIILVALIMCWLLGMNYVIAFMMTVVVIALFMIRTTQIIGGITGDVIGAGTEFAQIIWLLTFAVIGGL